MSEPRVAVVMGSDSGWPVMQEAVAAVAEFGVGCTADVVSAHRMPEETTAYARTARGRGLKVIIALAGLAAHLPGVVASHTTIPVLGVPLSGGVMGGLDALLSIVQMPGGVPVGCLALDKQGARNAAVLAAQILGLSDPDVAARLDVLKEDLARGETI